MKMTLQRFAINRQLVCTRTQLNQIQEILTVNWKLASQMIESLNILSVNFFDVIN